MKWIVVILCVATMIFVAAVHARTNYTSDEPGRLCPDPRVELGPAREHVEPFYPLGPARDSIRD